MSYDGCYGLKGLPLLAQRSWRYPNFEELRIPRPVPNTIGAISLLVAKHRNVEEGEKSQTKVIAIPVMNGKLVVRDKCLVSLDNSAREVESNYTFCLRRP